LLAGKSPSVLRWLWEGSVSHAGGFATPLSPSGYCQTPSHSSNFPELPSHPGLRLGSTINGNFTVPESSSKRFPLPLTLYLVLAEFSFICEFSFSKCKAMLVAGISLQMMDSRCTAAV